MKRTVIALFSLLILISLPLDGKGSWVYFSPDQLIKEADVIVTGRIEGPVGERPEEGANPRWYTDWKVTVHSYVGRPGTGETVVVTTPGAPNKENITSIDYRLDQWGTEALLFLKKWDGVHLEPITPAGIVILSNGEIVGQGGHSPEELRQFKAFLENAPRYSPVTGSQVQLPSGQKTWPEDYLDWPFALLAVVTGAGVLLYLIWIRRRSRKR